jgi:hypothetical protein
MGSSSKPQASTQNLPVREGYAAPAPAPSTAVLPEPGPPRSVSLPKR